MSLHGRGDLRKPGALGLEGLAHVPRCLVVTLGLGLGEGALELSDLFLELADHTGRAGAGLDWTVKSAVIMTASSAAIFALNFRTILFDSPFGNGFFAWAASMAVFGTTLPTALFSAGIPKIGAAASAVIMTVELPVAVLCAAAVLGERVGALQIAGIAAMLFGIALINYRKARAGGD